MRGPEDFTNKERVRESSEYNELVIPSLIMDLIDAGCLLNTQDAFDEYLKRVKTIKDFREYCREKGFDKKTDVEKLIKDADDAFFDPRRPVKTDEQRDEDTARFLRKTGATEDEIEKAKKRWKAGRPKIQ